MIDRHLIKRGKVTCPRCDSHKGIMGKSATGHPATIICPRCDGHGEIWADSLTEIEKNPPSKVFFQREDNP